MSTAAHAAVGIILVKYLESKGLIIPSFHTQFLLTSVLASNLPDLDGLLFRKIINHRDNSPFHYPLTWWFISITAIVLTTAERHRFLLPYLYISILAIFLHLFLDTFGVNAGICWLKPFTTKEYSFLPITNGKPITINQWLMNYIKSPMMLIEVIVILLGLFLLFI